MTKRVSRVTHFQTRTVALFVALLLAIGGLFVAAPQALAETGGYPYASYQGPGSDPSESYWTDENGNPFSPNGYNYRNCTDYVAWKLKSLGVPDSKVRGLGNGGQWAASASDRSGVSVSTSPSAGAAAVKPTSPPGDPYGHVAFVEAVNSNGTINISEYNYAWSGAYHTRTGTPSALGFTHFVNFGLNPLSVSMGAGSGQFGYTDQSSGVMHSFAATGSDLRHYAKDPNGPWGGEIIATGAFRANPAAFTDGAGAQHVFAVTSGDIRHYAKSPGGAWGGEVVATASSPSALSAFVDSQGALHVFYTASSNLVHYAKSPGGAWGGEIIASGSFSGSPSAFAHGAGALTVFASTSGDVRRYVKWSPSSAWGGEVVATAATPSGQSAYMESSGALHTYYVTNGALIHTVNYGSGWGSEVVASASFTGAPSAFLTPQGEHNAFVSASGDVRRYAKSGASAWAGEVVATPSSPSSPAAYVDGTGNQHLYYVANNTLVHHLKAPGAQWGGEIIG